MTDRDLFQQIWVKKLEDEVSKSDLVIVRGMVPLQDVTCGRRRDVNLKSRLVSAVSVIRVERGVTVS